MKLEYEQNVQKGSLRLLCMYLLKFYKAQLEFSIYGSGIPQGKKILLLFKVETKVYSVVMVFKSIRDSILKEIKEYSKVEF